MTSSPIGPVVTFEPSLGRLTRAGTWAQRSRGTFRAATASMRAGRGEDAALLIEVSLLEAQELREIYQLWPEEIERWVRDHGAPADEVATALARLTDLVGESAMAGIEAGWPQYADAVAEAARRCRSCRHSGGPASPAPGDLVHATAAIDRAREAWQSLHDQAVDRVAGMVDLAVRLCGEDCLPDLWDFLMRDWYDLHAKRYDLANQSWASSAHQLLTAIVDGFHAHLAGPDRQGDIELIEEPDRIGFRFAPCGSGGRSVASGITGGAPRSGPPFNWAVTTRPHDWAWNKIGICSYCVHCCLLNVVMPIDRLGYPTRVVEPPTWPAEQPNPTCTWWVYRHPSLIPDSIYEEVGRVPGRRPQPAEAGSGSTPQTEPS